MESVCVICNETFEQGEKIQTECGHEFHTECISEWVIKTDNCPLCRHTNPCGDKTYYYTFTHYFNNNKLNDEDKKRYNVFNKHVVSRYVDNRVYQLNNPNCTCGMCHLRGRGTDVREVAQFLVANITDFRSMFDVITTRLRGENQQEATI
jgi:hypothetical protein